MIDFEKLKFAIELCRNSFTYYFLIEFSPIHDSDEIIITLMNSASNRGDSMASLDDLIEKLQELTKPEPKYLYKEVVWLIDNGNPIEGCICEISTGQYGEYTYRFSDDSWRSESELFPTREALIEHQIEYWLKLKQEYCTHPNKYYQEGDGTYDCDDCGTLQMQWGCQHESDGMIYTSIPPKNKCKKCGEFY